MKYILVIMLLFPSLSHASSSLAGKYLICESLDGRSIGFEFSEEKVEVLYVEKLDDGRPAIYGWSKEYSTTYDEIKVGIRSDRLSRLMKDYKQERYLLKINRHDLAFMVRPDPDDWEVREFEELKNFIGNTGSCRVPDDLTSELFKHYQEENKKQRRMF